MLAEHVRTLFLVSWKPPGGNNIPPEQEEEYPRKADAMAAARKHAAKSWTGTAVVEMVIEEEGDDGSFLRMVRAWEVTPDACEQVSGGRERSFK